MNQDETFEDLVVAERENLEYEAKDEDLIQAIDTAIQDSSDLKEKIDELGKRNKLFWAVGTDKDLSKAHPKHPEVVDNRIFTDVETSIPIVSAETPEATVLNVPNELRESISKFLQICYEVKDKIQQVLQKMVRHWYLYRIGVVKYRWDEDEGFITENVLPRKIGFDKRATSLDNCEYIWEELEDTVENLIEKFPKHKDEIEEKYSKAKKSKIKYKEFWGGNGEWVAWKLDKIILDKKKNPNWDYDEIDNIFKKRKFPYIFFNVFNLGDETGMYDETSLIEEAIPLQIAANKLETQMLELNEGQKRIWAISAETMSQEMADDLASKTGDQIIYYDRKAPVGGIQIPLAGKADASFQNSIAHILGEIDNIFGTHSTTRGDRKEAETLGGRKMLQASDYGRLDLIVRNVEQVMEEWYNARLHMLKVYTDEPQDADDGENQIQLDPTTIPIETVIMVKKGSTLPVDKRSRMDMAVELAKGDKIDPMTLFTELGYGDAEERTKKLYEWLVNTGKAQMPEGQGGEQGNEQLVRLQDILQSPEFQNLPPEEKQAKIQQARQIVEQIKQGQ